MQSTFVCKDAKTAEHYVNASATTKEQKAICKEITN